VDVMVANAGIAVTASLLETTAEQSQRTPDVNFSGVAHCYSAMPRKGTRPGSEMAAVVAAIPLGRSGVVPGLARCGLRHRPVDRRRRRHVVDLNRFDHS